MCKIQNILANDADGDMEGKAPHLDFKFSQAYTH